jgi:hypothetical protein
MEASYCARACAGTLSEIQASYFVKKSSQSATPIFSPLAGVVAAGLLVVVAGLLVVVAGELVVVVVVVVVLLLALVVVALLLLVSAPPHALKKSAHATQSIRGTKFLFSTYFSSNVRTGEGAAANTACKDWKSAGIIHENRSTLTDAESAPDQQTTILPSRADAASAKHLAVKNLFAFSVMIDSAH